MKSGKILILDGYVDEPSNFGVPPYLSTYSRYIYGAAADAFEKTGGEKNIDYLTIKQYRKKKQYRDINKILSQYGIIILVNNTPVPGKYLVERPASERELSEIAKRGFDNGSVVLSWKSEIENAVTLEKDGDAYIYDLILGKPPRDRYRNMEEWNRWSVKGAGLICKHPSFPDTLILEIDTLKGCVRYINGGCSFCTEPLEKFRMRTIDSVIKEIRALVESGGKNFRIAGSCIFSFQARGIGKTERPTPDPKKIGRLLKTIRYLVPEDGVIHVDNGNAGIIASHPRGSEEILRAVVGYTSPGNSISIGMESADPELIKRNNLNASEKEVEFAVKLINKIGNKQGWTGLPKLLPGLNIICGLPGESRISFEKNLEFLKRLRKMGMRFRRINIRQLSQVRINFQTKKSNFVSWKRLVREKIDLPNLLDILPQGTVLKNIYIETHDGGNSFGRQVGTYPILAGVPFYINTGKKIDLLITDHGLRSVTGIPVPFDVNNASLRELSSLPKIGKKRAARIKLQQPMNSYSELQNSFQKKDIIDNIRKYLYFGDRKK